MAIKEFRGKYYFLSNFYSVPVIYEGIIYQNNEAAFQAQKTLNISQRQQFSNLDPSSAKRKGRRIQLRNDWEKIRFDIMYNIIKAKFTQNEHLGRYLLSTGDEYLEEGNSWHDNIYGNCMCDRCKNIKGRNKLGEILMRIREELKERGLM